jgi:hypothetical protein
MAVKPGARSLFFCILPVAPSGIASTNTTSSGVHHLAILPSKNFSRSLRVSSLSGFFTTTSSGRSSHLGCGGDAGGHGHGRVRHRDVLQVDGADPLAAGLDHVLAAVGDLHEAVGVDGGDVAGGEPAVTSGSPPSPLKYC